jgi:hypothetical protein
LGITAQVETTGIPGIEAFRKFIVTADKHARHGNVDQNTLGTPSIVLQHASVATFKPPTLSVNIILGSHDRPLSPCTGTGLDDE